MARADAKTAVLADGLRYKSKVSGSPFAATTSFGAATMSCFMCGKHRARSMMGTRKVLGKSQAVCSPSCKALDLSLIHISEPTRLRRISYAVFCLNKNSNKPSEPVSHARTNEPGARDRFTPPDV